MDLYSVQFMLGLPKSERDPGNPGNSREMFSDLAIGKQSSITRGDTTAFTSLCTYPRLH